MATDLVDFAALDATADAAATTDTSVETQDTTEDVAAVETTEAKTTEDSEKNADGTDKTPEQKAENAKAKETATSDGKVTPDSISKVLKSIKDADPKNAGAVKALRDAFFGEQAFKKEFATVQAARDAKAFIEAVGGVEGWENTQSVITNIEETDALVHSGDAKIWENIVEDLKSENHLDALPKLAAGGLDTLKANNETQYYEVIAPHFLAGLESVNLPGAIASLNKYLGVAEQELTKAEYKGDKQGILALKTIAKDMTDWIKGLQDESKAKKEAATKVDPERVKFNQERDEFNKQKTEKEQADAKEFRNNVATECDKYSNVALGTALKDYLKMPFFKGFPRETLVDLGNGIKQRLYGALENDKAYQIQMKAMWKQKSPDRAKITQYHNAKLDAIAADIVKQTVENRYPGYAKGGSAAGRVAAAAVKKTTETKAAAESVSSGKPIYVAAKPKDLVREAVKINGKDYAPNDLTLMEIGGKGFVKSTDGKFRLITWRK
jgi:hypothetical protein